MNGRNKAQLRGNACGDADVRNLQNGGKVANFTLATNESWKDKNSGEWKEAAEFHRIVIFDERLVEKAERDVKKGVHLELEGKIKTRRWTDQSGTERYTTEIVLERFRGELTILDKRDSKSDGQTHSQSDYGGATDDLDDSIPFAPMVM